MHKLKTSRNANWAIPQINSRKHGNLIKFINFRQWEFLRKKFYVSSEQCRRHGKFRKVCMILCKSMGISKFVYNFLNSWEFLLFRQN